jgi:dolichyl-phosphate-mannose-protein mannosyltransferase
MKRCDFSPRREMIAICVLSLLGAGLRLWSVNRLGLTHFDEGMYALAGLWVLSPKGLSALDPMLIPYAPPGLPILVGWAYGLLGVSDLSAILPSLVCGVALIPIVAWLARRAFGAGAGAAAAAFAALSGPHVAFSRMAMTDVPFLLAWLVAIGLGGWFLERPGWGRALALGLAVGGAQNFKYNGWLAGVIVAIGAVPGCLDRRPEVRRPALRAIGLGVIAVAVAAVAYWPWYQFVERHGGYASLLAHHRGYMSGPSAWWPHWRAQMAQAVALSGGPVWGASAWALAWLAVAFVREGRSLVLEPLRAWSRWDLGLPLGAAVLAGVPDLPWWVGLCGTVAWWPRSGRPGVRLLAFWWLILSLLTPFYHPYARLWLPLHGAGWVAMTALVMSLAARHTGSAEASSWSDQYFKFETSNFKSISCGRHDLGIAVVCLFLAIVQASVSPRARALPGLLAPTDSLREVALAVRPIATDRARTPLKVLARPAVTFELALEGQIPIQTQDSLDQLVKTIRPGELALVDEAVARPAGGGPLLANPGLRGWRVRGRWTTQLSLPTLLDLDPGAAFGAGRAGRADLVLLRAPPKIPGP